MTDIVDPGSYFNAGLLSHQGVHTIMTIIAF